MRIGISTSVMQRGRSGVGQYVLSLVRGLLAENSGDEIVLFVLEEDRALFEFAKDATTIVPVSERYRSAVWNIFWHHFCLPSLVRSLRLDVLHIPSYRRMLWRKPCALVATIHDLAPFRFPKKYDALRMFYGRFVANLLARRQDRIIAVSNHTRDDISHFFQIPSERITTIYNGMEHARFAPHDEPIARDELLSAHRIKGPFFLYVSRLEHPAKNHVRLIDAFEQFKASTGLDWKLVLAGSDWHGAEAIHARVAISPNAEDIHCVGFVSDAILPRWYRAADVFVYPSLYEGFGLPPIEAMACGCPVIASSRGALGEVVGDAAEIIEDPENSQEIARHLISLATDVQKRRRLRTAGFQRAKLFNWSLTTRATLLVYQSSLEAVPTPNLSCTPAL